MIISTYILGRILLSSPFWVLALILIIEASINIQLKIKKAKAT